MSQNQASVPNMINDEAIRHMTNLQRLYLDNDNAIITDDGIKLLINLPTDYFNNNNNNNVITNDGINFLNPRPAFNFNNNVITDDGIDNMADLRSIDEKGSINMVKEILYLGTLFAATIWLICNTTFTSRYEIISSEIINIK
jgi:hypothetical protein